MGVHGQGHAFAGGDGVSPIVCLRARHIGRQACIGINAEVDALRIALLIIDIAVNIAGLAQVFQCKGAGLVVLRQQRPDILLAALPAIAKLSLVYAGVYGQGHAASLLDCVFHILGFGPGYIGLQTGICGNIKGDIFPVAIVITHVTIHVIMPVHAGDREGCRAVILREQGGVQVRAVPLVMKIANIDAGFHGQRDAFSLLDGNLRICIRSSPSTGPESGIRREIELHILAVFVVVGDLAHDCHLLIHAFKREGIAHVPRI